MAPITKELLRKRAEHNEGMISTLKEVSLHQQEIEKIENLGTFCRELEILYLQNNLIGRLENLRRLKDLQYLNVAVNNIKLIENLERCESLNKLDLTVNFLDLEGLLSITRLRANYQLKDLYLTGNPCTDFDGYRKFVVATLPQLKRLDGKEIPHSERIEALQDLPAIKERLIQALVAKGVDVHVLMENPSGGLDDGDDEDEDEEEEPMYNEKGERVRKWSAKTRVLEHREMMAMREAAEKQKAANKDELLKAPPAPPRRTGFDPLPEGKIFQKNEGKWDFELLDSHDGKSILLDVAVGKFLDTSLLDVDVQPHAVRVLIKGRLLQLALPEEVSRVVFISVQFPSVWCFHQLGGFIRVEYKAWEADALKSLRATLGIFD
eukprot:jgi/Mesvir1/14281/Mv09711-RA.1